jgi:hypothetical protein
MSPHPYRLAMSCLDTPPAPCEPPKKRRQLPMEVLVLACAFVAAVAGIATLHAVGRGGHVEIAPAAVAHARRAPVQKQRTPPRARIERDAPILQAPFLRGGTHDPKTLLGVAKQLQSVGLDLTVSEIEIAKPIAPSVKWPTFIPVRGSGDRRYGLELTGMAPTSPFAALGLANGDEILAVDGYDLAESGGIHIIDLLQPYQRHWVIVEIARGVHHVVLSIQWPVT